MGKYYSYVHIPANNARKSQNQQRKTIERYFKKNQIECSEEFNSKKDFIYMEHLSLKDTELEQEFEERMKFHELERRLERDDTVVFKEFSNFARDAEDGYRTYMDWMKRGINIVFVSNPTLSTDYIKQLLSTAQRQELMNEAVMESVIKLLMTVELDRLKQQWQEASEAIRDGIQASDKRNGRKKGSIDKLSDALRADIEKYLSDSNIKLIDIMLEHKISRNTLKKYIQIIKEANEEDNIEE